MAATATPRHGQEPDNAPDEFGLTPTDWATYLDAAPPGTARPVTPAAPVMPEWLRTQDAPATEEQLQAARDIAEWAPQFLQLLEAGHDVGDVLASESRITYYLYKSLRSLIDPERPAPKPTAAELAALEPIAIPVDAFLETANLQVDWFAHEVAVEGGITLCLGLPASFKTMASLELGFCSAAGHDWLGIKIAKRPVIYVSNEKSRATIADRIRHLAAIHPPQETILIAHRCGIEFGNPAWDRLVAQAATMDRPLVILDTLASLSPGTFDENSTKDMGTALHAIRDLTNANATVFLLHHPKKPGKEGAPVSLSGRGSGRLDGEIDGWIEFRRSDPTEERVTLYARPKDATGRRMSLIWNPETFCFERDEMGAICTPKAVADTIADTWNGEPMTTAALEPLFPSHKPTHIGNMVTKAHQLGLIRKVQTGHYARWAPPTTDNPLEDWPAA
jgi:hypothetical protein